jgi:hypothetical protein
VRGELCARHAAERLETVGERAAARSLGWAHKYVEVTHPDGSVLRAAMYKTCINGEILDTLC